MNAHEYSPKLTETSFENCRCELKKKAGNGRYGPRIRCIMCGRSHDAPSPRRIGKRRVKPLTAKEVRMIAECLRLGRSVEYIQNATGLARVTVYRWIKKIDAIANLKPKLLYVVIF